jgi:hypothetical protein
VWHRVFEPTYDEHLRWIRDVGEGAPCRAIGSVRHQLVIPRCKDYEIADDDGT